MSRANLLLILVAIFTLSCKRSDNDSSHSTTKTFKSTNSVYFDGVDDYVNFGDAQLLLGGTSFDQITISYWGKMDSAEIYNNYNGVMGVTTDPLNWSDGLAIYWSSSTTLTVHFPACGVGLYKSGLDANQWNHFVVVYDKGDVDSVKLYVNGLLTTPDGTYGTPVTCIIPSADFEAGRVVGDTGVENEYNIKGWMDEWAIWTDSLSPEQVAKLFGSGKPIDLSKSVVSNPAGWCHLGEGFSSGNFIEEMSQVNNIVPMNMSLDPRSSEVP